MHTIPTLPVAVSWWDFQFAIQNGIIFKSQDAGQSWLQVFAEDGRQCEDSTYIYSHDLFVSPNYAQDRTVYWLNWGVLYASYDDGVTWTPGSLPPAAEVYLPLVLASP